MSAGEQDMPHRIELAYESPEHREPSLVHGPRRPTFCSQTPPAANNNTTNPGLREPRVGQS